MEEILALDLPVGESSHCNNTHPYMLYAPFLLYQFDVCLCFDIFPPELNTKCLIN